MIQMRSKTFSVYTRPSRSVIAETARSRGNVMRQNRCQPVAPSMAADSYTSFGITCKPLYSRTRLNGMPIQTLAMITDASDQSGDVSQLTGPTPTTWSALLTMPESLWSIHDQVDAETINGSSHGTRNSARSPRDNGKEWLKKTASARPMVNWNIRDTSVNTT